MTKVLRTFYKISKYVLLSVLLAMTSTGILSYAFYLGHETGREEGIHNGCITMRHLTTGELNVSTHSQFNDELNRYLQCLMIADSDYAPEEVDRLLKEAKP